jgi:hypothetical protein
VTQFELLETNTGGSGIANIAVSSSTAIAATSGGKNLKRVRVQNLGTVTGEFLHVRNAANTVIAAIDAGGVYEGEHVGEALSVLNPAANPDPISCCILTQYYA